MIKNMTVPLPHLEKSDDSTRVGCRLALNGCFITVSDRCRDPPPATPSCCRGASSQQTNVTRAERTHWCALFCKEHQSSYVCLYRRYCIILNNKCPPDVWLNLVSQKCLRQERNPFTTRSLAGNVGLAVIHHLFQGRCTAAGH